MSFQRFESKFVPAKKGKVKAGTLRLSGDLTIQDAVALKETVLDALSKVDTCMLDLELVNIFDLSSIQVLYAAFKSARAKEKNLELAGECPNVFRNAVFDSGFEKVEWFGFG